MLFSFFNFFASPLGFFVVIGAFFVGAIGSLLSGDRDGAANVLGTGGALVGSLAGLALSFSIVVLRRPFTFDIPVSFPFFRLDISIDYLSAFFVGVISLIAFACSLYAAGYLKHFFGKYPLSSLGFFYNIFIASMLLVVTAHNALFFLASWEIMSLASYFLVIFEWKNEENISAGFLYFVMTHVGTACILLAMLLLGAYAGSFDFTAFAVGAALMPLWVKNVVFLLALIGFGTKAGIIPMHIWLPRAHPAAPSHVSALMSGVMIKTGIYMCIRIFFDILPGDVWWWGILVLAIGAISSVLGVLYALAEHDIKKLLAYHSIENIGIIFLGLGSSLVFTSLHMPLFALTALAAALFHTLNHALFKALLFLGAGSVVSATHTRNIEDYGGLIKAMPYTAFFFLIGSLAISGLPPLNGFASEWLTFQSFFVGMRFVAGGIGMVFGAAAAALALTGGLAAACFVKAFGATFLARPRSEQVTHAKEAGTSELAAMGLLTIMIVLFGFFAGSAAAALGHVGMFLTAFQGISIARESVSFSLLHISGALGSTSLPVLFGLLAITIGLGYLLIRMLAGQRKEERNLTWDCGTDLSPRMEMTATTFSQSIITVFATVLRPFMHIEIAHAPSAKEVSARITHVHLGLHDVYRTYVYGPFAFIIAKISEYARRTQQGNVSVYILYMLLALLILLVFAAL